ncbi:MAG: acetyl-CoA carboxylase biotin carboxylase subunit, partial [Planctomycetota bacterium]
VDIVKTGLLVAGGEPLPFKQRDIRVNGHAIECRINAEDWQRNFMPSAGRIEKLELPGGLGIRNDTHAVPGYTVPPTYDSMIGKLIVHGSDRDEAIRRTKRALDEMTIEPINTTISLHQQLMENENFRAGGMDIHFLERLLG